MKYIHIIVGLLITSMIMGQNNLIPNPGFENAKPGRSPQCDYYADQQPKNIQDDIQYWNNARKTYSSFNDNYRKSSPDWHVPGFNCTNQPFSTSRHMYLEEHGAVYQDAIITSLLAKMQPNNNYLFKITYATGKRKNNNQCANGAQPIVQLNGITLCNIVPARITVWFTKYSTHWSSDYGNVKFHFDMYPPSAINGWVQHWSIIPAAIFPFLGNVFSSLNNIVIDCQDEHVYIDYVELAVNCDNPLLLENHQFTSLINEIPYKSGGVLKAGYNVGSPQANGNVVVRSGANVTFKAATQIFLEPGFTAEHNSTFKTIIEPCDNSTVRTIGDTVEVIDDKTIKIGDITIYDDSREVLPCDNDDNEDGGEDDDSNDDNDEEYDVIIYGLDGDTTSFISYWWDYGNGETSTNPVAKIEFEEPGEYLVKLALTDSSGVTDTLSKTYIKPDCNRVRQTNKSLGLVNNLNIYPNPTKGQFTIELGYVSKNTLVEVYDLMGRVVWSNINVENKTQIDISNQPKGIYLVKVLYDNKVFTEKVIYN